MRRREKMEAVFTVRKSTKNTQQTRLICNGKCLFYLWNIEIIIKLTSSLHHCWKCRHVLVTPLSKKKSPRQSWFADPWSTNFFFFFTLGGKKGEIPVSLALRNLGMGFFFFFWKKKGRGVFLYFLFFKPSCEFLECMLCNVHRCMYRKIR